MGRSLERRPRTMARGFGWVDHRFVREGHIRRCSKDALALYLFYVVVGDGDGVSWYSDARICRELRMDEGSLGLARKELVALSLVSHAPPDIQVLELPKAAAVDSGAIMDRLVGLAMAQIGKGESPKHETDGKARQCAGPVSIAEAMDKIMGK